MITEGGLWFMVFITNQASQSGKPPFVKNAGRLQSSCRAASAVRLQPGIAERACSRHSRGFPDG